MDKRKGTPYVIILEEMGKTKAIDHFTSYSDAEAYLKSLLKTLKDAHFHPKKQKSRSIWKCDDDMETRIILARRK